GRLQERARAPRVAPDDDAHALLAHLGGQGRGQLAADAVGEIGSERRLVGHAPDAVRAEEPAHRFDPVARCCLAPSGRMSTVRTSARAACTLVQAGVTRVTRTPIGAWTLSGSRWTRLSPSRSPLTSTRTRTVPGLTCSAAQRVACN